MKKHENPIKKPRWQRPILAIATFYLAAQLPAWAHSANEAPMSGLILKVRQSALVVYGKVVDIQYKSSLKTQIQPKGVPHTFVTYEVQDTLRGIAPGNKITLRIPGGADGEGGVYMETSSPAFSLGQTDVLFLKGGDITDCQLVNCVEGRFRIHENQVFNGWGVPVVEAGKRLRLGGKPRFDLNVMDLPRPSFRVLSQKPELRAVIDKMLASGMTMEQLEAKYNAEAPTLTQVKLNYQSLPIRGDVSGRPALPVVKSEAPISPDVFFEAIKSISLQEGEPISKFVMADVNTNFTVPDPRPIPMKEAITPDPNISTEERNDTTILK